MRDVHEAELQPVDVARDVHERQLHALHALRAIEQRGAVCDVMFFLRELVRKGVGIGVLPTFLAEADVTRGALVPVRTRHRFPSVDAYLVRQAQKQVARRVTAFSEVLLELLRQRPLGAR